MKTGHLLDQIIAEKERTGAKILAHTYQTPDILTVADVVGDSFALAQAATSLSADRVVVCGVRFMAETVKILSPQKQVILPSPTATCPMAEQIAPAAVASFKREHPEVAVVCYINTTAAFKAECDICVTSSSAVRIVRGLEADTILFVPDQNLGAFVQKEVPEKSVILWDGCCPIHHAVTAADVLAAKAAHPAAKVAVHPECRPEVAALADMIGATGAIIDYLHAESGEIIVGTERGVVDGIRAQTPGRVLHQLRPDLLTCPDMKQTTPEILYRALRGESGENITLDEPLRLRAKHCLDEMLQR